MFHLSENTNNFRLKKQNQYKSNERKAVVNPPNVNTTEFSNANAHDI